MTASLLAEELIKYSELGQDYVEIIQAIIRDNELEHLDKASIASRDGLSVV